MYRCKLGYPINKDGTIPQRCHVDWDDGFYPISCKECPFYISEYEDELKYYTIERMEAK